MKGFIFTIIVILCCILLYLNLSLSYRKNKIKRIEYIKASIDIDQINGFLSILNDSKFSTLGKKYIIILPEEVCERCGSKEKFLNIVKYINIGAELNILTQYFNSTEYNILRRHALNFPDNINLYYNKKLNSYDSLLFSNGILILILNNKEIETLDTIDIINKRSVKLKILSILNK